MHFGASPPSGMLSALSSANSVSAATFKIWLERGWREMLSLYQAPPSIVTAHSYKLDSS